MPRNRSKIFFSEPSDINQASRLPGLGLEAHRHHSGIWAGNSQPEVMLHKMAQLVQASGKGDPSIVLEIASFADSSFLENFGMKVDGKPVTKLEQLPPEFLKNMADSLAMGKDSASIEALKILTEARKQSIINVKQKNMANKRIRASLSRY